MHSFEDLLNRFETHFAIEHFPAKPESLYQPASYILQLGGKRIRPVCVLMGNELFDEITTDAWHTATAVELFHNFSLIHDDIMDKSPLRRGKPTVHEKYGANTAILAGDAMLVKAYVNLNKVKGEMLQKVLPLFNTTSLQVCEGQQLDMDFEKRNDVSLEEYVEMITLKTSVLLAASLQLGALIGGAGEGNQKHLYEFGKNLGIAFQIQDDYLDAFGNPEKFGKQVGGDIIANKKTFLMIHAAEVADAAQQKELALLKSETDTKKKVTGTLQIFKDCKIDEWAENLKQSYFEHALKHLEDVAVLSARKGELYRLAELLMNREK